MKTYKQVTEKIKRLIEPEFDFNNAAKINSYWQIHIWKKGYFQYKRILSIKDDEPENTMRQLLELNCMAIKEDIKRAENVLNALIDTMNRW
jgi:hypothetical protein